MTDRSEDTAAGCKVVCLYLKALAGQSGLGLSSLRMRILAGTPDGTQAATGGRLDAMNTNTEVRIPCRQQAWDGLM